MPNDQLVVRPNGQVSRLRGNTSFLQRATTLAETLLRNPQFRSMVASGGEHLYKKVSNHMSNSSSKKAPLVIKEVPRPVAISVDSTRRGPHTQPLKKGGIRVVNRELVDSSITIPSTWGFDKSNQYQINPGLSDLFPWLSTVAQNYTEWKAHKIVLEWIPSCPTTTSGDVIMTPMYDPTLPWPADEVSASDLIDTKTGSVFVPHALHLKMRSLMSGTTRKLVRSYAMAGNRTAYDGGRIMISGVNGPGTGCGKLFITYDIELYVPRLAALTASLVPSNTCWAYLNASQTFTNGVQAKLNFTVDTTQNPIDISFSGGDFSAPYGYYKVEVFIVAQDLTGETFSLTAGCDGSNVYNVVNYGGMATIAAGELMTRSFSFFWHTGPGLPNAMSVYATLSGAAGVLSCLGVTGGVSRTYAIITLQQ